jgi:hypothetical protein
MVRLTSADMPRLQLATTWSGTDVLPRRYDVLAALRPVVQIMGLSSAGSFLNIPILVIQKLVAAGVLSPCWPTPPTYSMYFYGSELASWFAGFIEGVPIVEEMPAGSVLLRPVRREGRTSLFTRILMLHHKEMAAVGCLRTRTGFSRILIARDKTLIRQFSESDGVLRKDDIGRLLNVKIPTLPFLCDADILPDRRAGQARIASPEDVRKFRSLYVSHLELLELMSIDKGDLKSRAAQVGLRSLTPAWVTRVYAWSDVSRLLGFERPA